MCRGRAKLFQSTNHSRSAMRLRHRARPEIRWKTAMEEALHAWRRNLVGPEHDVLVPGSLKIFSRSGD